MLEAQHPESSKSSTKRRAWDLLDLLVAGVERTSEARPDFEGLVFTFRPQFLWQKLKKQCLPENVKSEVWQHKKSEVRLGDVRFAFVFLMRKGCWMMLDTWEHMVFFFTHLSRVSTAKLGTIAVKFQRFLGFNQVLSSSAWLNLQPFSHHSDEPWVGTQDTFTTPNSV